MKICRVKSCLSEAIEDFCGYHEEAIEEGSAFDMKPRQNRKRLEEMTARERADAQLRIRKSQRDAKRRKVPESKHREIATESIEELAEIYTARVMQARAAFALKHPHPEEEKATRMEKIREGLAQRKRAQNERAYQ